MFFDLARAKLAEVAGRPEISDRLLREAFAEATEALKSHLMRLSANERFVAFFVCFFVALLALMAVTAPVRACLRRRRSRSAQAESATNAEDAVAAAACAAMHPSQEAVLEEMDFGAQATSRQALQLERERPEAQSRRRSRVESPAPRAPLGAGSGDEPPSRGKSHLSGAELELLRILNTGDAEELLSVRHVGQKVAEKIMCYRETQGELLDTGDLVGKVGLAQATVTKIVRSLPRQAPAGGA
jgi:DNA uptake protein ComE-like DNA-binding protein